jgi:hypothetical protein
MDPNATLELLRGLAAQILEQFAEDATTDLGVELAEAVENMDHWLTKGGCLPDAWQLAVQAELVEADRQEAAEEE